MNEPPPYRRCYIVTNTHADTYKRIGVLITVLDTDDDPDLRERRFVLDFCDDSAPVAYHKDEIEQVYV